MPRAHGQKWDVFSLYDPHNREKTWYLFLKQSGFPLYDLKLYVKGLNKGYNADEYVVPKLKFSGSHLQSSL